MFPRLSNLLEGDEVAWQETSCCGASFVQKYDHNIDVFHQRERENLLADSKPRKLLPKEKSEQNPTDHEERNDSTGAPHVGEPTKAKSHNECCGRTSQKSEAEEVNILNAFMKRFAGTGVLRRDEEEIDWSTQSPNEEVDVKAETPADTADGKCAPDDWPKHSACTPSKTGDSHVNRPLFLRRGE
ncbi:hypothetical protein MPH_01968 [Macrophomina phaseolina MS6]|uniref:Uncharacterized protein n=1 Tax=Macrophomina phaseolina (strain MS6) TaxID=1126212 RepID=K2SE58_MACPH|nr:hypothetical protein MPH_01968 [Macrophomina phaseolina MS6]